MDVGGGGLTGLAMGVVCFFHIIFFISFSVVFERRNLQLEAGRMGEGLVFRVGVCAILELINNLEKYKDVSFYSLPCTLGHVAFMKFRYDD